MLNAAVEHLENLLACQTPEQPFIIGISGSHYYFNTFISLFLEHHHYDILRIDCMERFNCVHQNGTEFIEERLSQAVAQCPEMKNPLILIENYGELNFLAKCKLNELLEGGKGLKIPSHENEDQNNDENHNTPTHFAPVFLSTLSSFEDDLVHMFFDQSNYYIESGLLRYNAFLKKTYMEHCPILAEHYRQLEKKCEKIVLAKEQDKHKPGI
jgi:hypothetical protein